MADNIQFVSWSRRGAAAGHSAAAQPDGRLHVSRSFTVTSRPTNGASSTAPAESAKVTVLGPGDVVGIDPSQILRRSPRPDDHNLEPNYLAAIEFGHPDLPWMFSPELGEKERAQPWLMLVVVEDPSGTAIEPAGIRKPCPTLTVQGADEVPEPKNAWAFAHVQVRDVGTREAAVALVKDLSNSAAIRSRVLCPTRLHPDRRYVAALVPTYEIGRLAGLGLPVPDGTGISLWVHTAGQKLPVYDSWQFWTGPSGDFETLAKKLHGVDAAAKAALGVRKVAIEAKASLLQPQGPEPDAFADVYDVPTAITRIDLGGDELAPDSAHPDPQAPELHRRLQKVVDLVAGASEDEPMVGPPLYGQWPAEVTSLEGNPQRSWIEQLNADPFLRAAAGVATLVVQHDQEELMADAWTQLEQLKAVNSRIRWASLYAHTTLTLHERVSALPPDAALRLLSPATSRLRESAELTFRAKIEASTVPPEALGSALAKTARYAVRAQARRPVPEGQPVLSTTDILSSTLEALRSGAEGALPARYTSARAIDQSVLDEVAQAPQFKEQLSQRLATPPAEYLERIRDVPHAIERVADRLVVQPVAPGVAEGDGTLLQLRPEALTHVVALSKLATEVHTSGRMELSSQVQTELAAIKENGVDAPISLSTLSALNEVATRFQRSGAHRKVHRLDLDAEAQEVQLDRQRISESTLVSVGATVEQARAGETVSALRAATLTDLGVTQLDLGQVVSEVTVEDGRRLRKMIEQVERDVAPTAGPVATPSLEMLDLEVSATLVGKLEPRRAYERLLSFAHEFADEGVVRRGGSEFHPAMAAPLFPKPAIERLKSIDEEWVLGGIGQLEPNSVCLLDVNWRFVESFLAGANHEMARELLWRGYPTDLRGTCFRRFWNGPDEDIRPMDHWDQPIGSHAVEGARADFTILLIKGDLLRRYPNTVIAAEKGTASKEGEVVSFASEDHRRELFRGFLGQDISYVAIDVPPKDLRFRDLANARHGWYISLTEPHEEPRFGLDDAEGEDPVPNAGHDPDQWSWQGLPPPVGPHLLPDSVEASLSSGQAGANLFQRPFRMLLRARDYV